MKYLIITALILTFGCKGTRSKHDKASFGSSENSKQITAEEALAYKDAQKKKDIQDKITAQEHEIEMITKLNQSGLTMLELIYDETKKNMETYNAANPQEDFTKFLKMTEEIKTMHDLGIYGGFAFTPNGDEEKDGIIADVLQMMKLYYLNKKQYDSIVTAQESVDRAKLLVQEK